MEERPKFFLGDRKSMYEVAISIAHWACTVMHLRDDDVLVLTRIETCDSKPWILVPGLMIKR